MMNGKEERISVCVTQEIERKKSNRKDKVPDGLKLYVYQTREEEADPNKKGLARKWIKKHAC